MKMPPVLNSFLPMIAWSVFIGCALLAIICGAIFAFHWFKFSINHSGALFAFVIYSVVAGFLLLGILTATIALIY